VASPVTRSPVIGIAIMFVTAGTAHFLAPAWFDQIMPPWVPNARLATLLSGAAEIAGGLGVLIPSTRVAAGWGLIALLLAVFPANVHMLQMASQSNAALWYRAALWARLPLQALLIWWVWRAAVRSR
jgi:uncharacterized membrane protein